MELGKFMSKIDKFPHFCSYCRTITGDRVFYWEKQPRLYFDTETCALKWAKSLADNKGNLTWPGVYPNDKKPVGVLTKEKTLNILTRIKKAFGRGATS